MAIIRTPPRPAWTRLLGSLAPMLGLGFLWIAGGRLVPAAMAARSAQFQGIVTTFLGIFIEALPFLLAGVIASVVIQQWVTPALLARWIPRHGVGAPTVGALLGLIFPVCECGAIPASRQLMRKGATPAVGMGFALAAPVVNPVVILSTMAA
ncbi:MAG TPA: permease, partial [Herpetosiphonaceae bacterium]|nr:permease [Herpetosiphonaceae bacterium]